MRPNNNNWSKGFIAAGITAVGGIIAWISTRNSRQRAERPRHVEAKAEILQLPTSQPVNRSSSPTPTPTSRQLTPYLRAPIVSQHNFVRHAVVRRPERVAITNPLFVFPENKEEKKPDNHNPSNIRDLIPFSPEVKQEQKPATVNDNTITIEVRDQSLQLLIPHIIKILNTIYRNPELRLMPQPTSTTTAVVPRPTKRAPPSYVVTVVDPRSLKKTSHLSLQGDRLQKYHVPRPNKLFPTNNFILRDKKSGRTFVLSLRQVKKSLLQICVVIVSPQARALSHSKADNHSLENMNMLMQAQACMFLINTVGRGLNVVMALTQVSLMKYAAARSIMEVQQRISFPQRQAIRNVVTHPHHASSSRATIVEAAEERKPVTDPTPPLVITSTSSNTTVVTAEEHKPAPVKTITFTEVINKAISGYKAWYESENKDSNADNRGIKQGKFSLWRHGDSGQKRATALLSQITNAGSDIDRCDILERHFNRYCARLNNHSLDSYLLDALSQHLDFKIKQNYKHTDKIELLGQVRGFINEDSQQEYAPA